MFLPEKKTIPTYTYYIVDCYMRNPVVGVAHSSCHGTVSRELAKDQIEFNCEEKKLELNKFVTFRP